MTTSSLSPTAATISITSSSIQGELSALIRVQRPVAAKSLALAMAMKPARAAALASAGMASSRLPSTTSTWPMSSGTLARSFSIWGGTKWIMRSSLTGSSLSGLGAPIASGLKKLRGSFIRRSSCGRLGIRKPDNANGAPRLAAGAAAVERASLQRNIRALDHLAPERGLVSEELGRLQAALAGGFHLNAARLFGHLRPSENLHHVAIDPVGERCRSLRGRHHGVPGDGAVTWQSFRDRRYLGQVGQPFRRAGGHDTELAVAMQLERRGRGVEHQVDMAGDDVVDGRPQPAIGHMRQLDVGEHLELHRRQMPD